MDTRRETGMVLIVGMAIVIMLVIGALCSCTTKTKVVTEYVNVHDTVQIHRTDTVKEVSWQVRVDTVRQTETHTITLNNVGDTIREVHFYHDREKVIVVDSTDRYKATVDSLRAALTTEKEKYKEVVKTKHVVKWWEWLLIVGIVVALLHGIRATKT